MKIAFFYEFPPGRMPPYVANDFDTCRQIGEVRWCRPIQRQRWRHVIGPRGWLPSASVLNLVRWCDVAVQWFADVPAPTLAARLLGKPMLLISGGYDTACLPAFGYGLMIDPRTRLMVKTTLNMATRVFAVSRFQLGEVMRWAPRAKASCLYHGCDAKKFRPRRQRYTRVVTVSRVAYDWIVKGLEVFALTAAQMRGMPFVIVGPVESSAAESRLRALAPFNLELAGELPHSDVACYLGSSAVYAQLSLHESFCLSLAEGMSSGCTPVVSECGALPEVAGDCAYYARPNDPMSSAEAIRAALRQPRGDAARSRIIRNFRPETRREVLATEIQEQSNGRSRWRLGRDICKTR